jgi:uncharacterized protein (TIGR03435 family)
MAKRKELRNQKPWLVAIGWLAAAVLQATAQSGAPPAAASSPTAAYVPTLTFDVASIRQSETAYSYTVSGHFSPHSGTLRVTNFSVENILHLAFGSDHYYQISGVPDSFRHAMFNIQAKADDSADERLAKLTNEQQTMEQQHMVQVLLADRFHLKAHWETQDGEVYNLVAKNRGKLHETKNDPPTPDDVKAFGGRPVPPLYQQGDSRNGFDFVAHACPIEMIVRMLAGQFGRPVRDKTGLTGKYDFVLHYFGTKDSDWDGKESNPLPPLETAIQDQLGLKLEPAKGPVAVLVIDHLDKPSEN